MLETYQVEILKKRRAARIFWLIVLLCSFLLYFFFQWKYPDIRVGLRLFSESGSVSLSGWSELMRSFGIINVRTIPTDTTILLGTGWYGNNEKRMSDYGNYTMKIEKSWYLNNVIIFKIDAEKPFFIEKISLLPLPTYKKINGAIRVYPIGNGEILIKTLSGITWSGSLIPGLVGYTGSFDPIGGKYFRTNSGIVAWEGGKFKGASQNIVNFVQTCKLPLWKYDLFYCAMSKSLITEWGKYMTGILDIHDHLIEQSGSVMEIKNGIPWKKWSQNLEIDLEKITIINSVLYNNRSGSLIPTTKTELNIITPLENIDHVNILGEDIVLLGKLHGQPHLIIRHAGDPVDRERSIELPENMSYKDIELHSIGWNIMIETTSGILLIYRWSHTYQWIVEWTILIFTDTGAIYEKNGQYWITDWNTKVGL